MKLLGLTVFILVVISLGLYSKLDKVSSRILKLEKSNLKREGIQMSEILKGLVGERCVLKESNGLVSKGTVLAVDDEWIKLRLVKKDTESVVVKRIDTIVQVSIMEE